jgi:uncharacterized protein
MDCPVDGTTLVMSDRQGIEIDYCPKCRGVWLDRGELDKLIEREQQWVTEQVSERKDGAAEPAKEPKKKKMSSWLQDVMELGQS